jgi:dTMP kinase
VSAEPGSALKDRRARGALAREAHYSELIVPARLITIEGIDGAGKTTLAAALREALVGRGIDAVALREPGGVALAERIRSLVKDPGLEITDRAEALLYAASRAQLVAERVEPELAAGRWVLLDRYVDSSLAYQGAGRGLGAEAVGAINEFATAGLAADRTLLLVIDPAAGRARRGDRGEDADRLEREADEFFARISAGYESLAAAEPARIRTLDATLPPRELLAAALTALADLLD